MALHDRDIPNNADDRISHGKSPYRDIDRDLDIPPHGISLTIAHIRYPIQRQRYPVSAWDIPKKSRDILLVNLPDEF